VMTARMSGDNNASRQQQQQQQQVRSKGFNEADEAAGFSSAGEDPKEDGDKYDDEDGSGLTPKQIKKMKKEAKKTKKEEKKKRKEERKKRKRDKRGDEHDNSSDEEGRRHKLQKV